MVAGCSNNSLSDDNTYFSNCKEMLNTVELNLYPFVQFTDEEMRMLPYNIKLERRQIPEDFLQRMTTKELFYQVVCCDLSKDMLVFNTMQQGFESVKRLNMLPELLNRPDAGHVLLEILRKVNPAQIKGSDCHWTCHCLNITGAQPEVINRMTDEDIDDYISQQLRCYDAIQSLDATNPEYHGVNVILFGLGNVMIRYEFEPFIQMLCNDPITNELIWDTQFITEQFALQVIDYIKQFKNRKK